MVDLVSSVRRSLLYSLADSYLGVSLQLASTLIISRLLTPSEIGIYAVAAVLAALASTFRDFGVAEYLIQEKNLTAAKIRAAFAANLMASWLMALLLFASSGAVAGFYRQPGVAEVMRIQAISFLLIPFGAVTIAYFRRELNYRPIFIGGLLANVTAFIVATMSAMHGFGYLSLAWSSLAGVLVTVVVSVVTRPTDFPCLPSFKGVAEVARFGKHASGIYLYGQIGKSAPEAVIGRVLDMASVAFFSRANGLMEIFNRTVLKAVLPVCLPYFSQATRAGQETRIGYLRATSMLTGIGWSFYLVVGILAFSIIRLLYGAQWMPAVPLAQILCLAAVFELPYFLAGEVMIAHGRIDQSNRLQFMVQGIRLAGLALVVPFGMVGACWGLVVAGLIGAVISHQFLHHIIGLRFTDVLRACVGSAGVAACCSAPVLVLVLVVPQTEANYLNVLIGAALLAALIWLIALHAFAHPFLDEIRSLSTKVLNKARRNTTNESD